MFEILVVAGLALGAVALLRRKPVAYDGLPPPGGPPASRAEAIRRILKHIQRRPIGELGEGTGAVVVGTAHAMPAWQPLNAPFSGRPCLGYHLEIFAPDKLGHFTRRLHDDARCIALEIRDDTGSLLVDPAGLELAITERTPQVFYPPHAPWLLARLPRGAHDVAISIEEGLLLPDAKLLVCGVAARELAATDYRDGEQRLLLRASATFPLVASTDSDLFAPGDRLIAPEEVRRR